jgi:CBS domain containing-hemolysin-like protein
MNWGYFLADHGWQIVAQAILLCGSAFFSLSETALFSLSRSQVYRLSHGAGPGRLVAAMVGRPRRLLNTILLSNMFVNTAYTALSAMEAIELQAGGLPTWAAALVSLVPLLVLILVGEVTPKVLGLAAGETAAVLVAPPLAVLERGLAPLLWVFQKTIISPVTRLLDVPPDPRGDVSAQELAALLRLSAKRGILEHDANTLLQEILELKDLRVRDIMVPRVDMLAFDLARPRADLLELFRHNRFRKVPVYEAGIDNVVGLIYAKRLVLNPKSPLRSLLVPVPFVPLQADLEKVLIQFRVTRTQMAIVVDEYGGTAGLVTLQDVLEEIVGDIPAPREGAASPPVRELGGGEYLVEANLAIHEWRDFLKIELPSRRISTIGGFVLSQLGHVPQVGEQVRFRNLLFTVESLLGRRIGTLRVRLEDRA